MGYPIGVSTEPANDKAKETTDWLKEKGAEALTKADELADKAQAAAEPVIENIKEAAEPVVEKAKGILGELVESFKDNVNADGTADTRSAIDKIKDAFTEDPKQEEKA